MKSDVKDLKLADAGRKKIEWAGSRMPVLASIATRFAKEKPLKNLRLSACLHVTSETANLMIALKKGGADGVLCASNPLSTQDEVAAALVKYYDIPVFAIHGEDSKTYYKHLKQALEMKPNITMDDGADLINELHKLTIVNRNTKYEIRNTKGEKRILGISRLFRRNNDGRYPASRYGKTPRFEGSGPRGKRF